MAADKSTFELLIEELGQAINGVLNDIGNPVKSPQTTLYFLRNLGWNVPESTDLSSSPLKFINSFSSINLSNTSDYGSLIGSLKNVISDFDSIKDNLGLGATLSDFGTKFPRQLLDYTIMRHMQYEHPKISAFFLFIGIFDNSYQPAALPAHIAYKQYRIEWERLIIFLQEPHRIPEIVYGWGTPTYDGKLLIENIEHLLNALEIQTGVYMPTGDITSQYSLSGDALYVPFFDLDTVKAGLEVYPIATDSTPNNAGLAVSPFFIGSAETEIVINENFSLLIKGGLKIDKTTGVEIRPKTAITLFDLTAASAINGSIEVTFRISGPEHLVQLGAPESTRLEIGAIELTGKAQVNQQGNDFTIEIAVKDSRVVIDLGGGDGFISSVLPLEPIEVPLDLTVGYSTKNGIYFKGSAGIQIQLPIHISLGPIEISGITIEIKIEDRKIPISVSADFKGELGPLTVVVENIGVSTNLSFPENNRGNMGPFDLGFGFKPPNGLGLSVNAGAVIGGGYLFFDFEKEEYAGVLELTIAGFISAKAIGLITTKMPDGSKGFSMLIIITAEFFPPFQLGYGFTLNAVGGLLGLNRTMLLDPLRNAVRTGAVNSIMFPQNVIANAPRIISDLKSIFPPYEERFLIGPMGKIGWGTPTLITLSLGIIIEIPGNIAILGVLKVALPTEQTPLVQIQVLFVGTIDFDKKMLTFDASLYESFILTMTLEGDMAVRLKWGDQPDFLLSVGGFHPSYTPPPLSLPTMKRLSLTILNTDIALIRVECYQAVTSNTVQFGAKAEIKFDLRACVIEGNIGFDALFQFSPFYFIIQVSASFKLSAAGIDILSVRVRMSLEGPTPWRAKGTGSVSILFFEISADFDVTWGEEKNTAIPEVAIYQKFLDDLQKREYWSTILSNNKNLLVSLRKMEESATAPLVLHPAGSLVVQQKILPLQVKIDKVGSQKVNDVQKITIKKATSDGSELKITEVNDNFARAQYQNLTDSEKLSKPSFEKMPNGVQISLSNTIIKNGKFVRKNVAYEITIIDKEPIKPFRKGRFFMEIGILFNHFLKGNSVSKSTLSKSHLNKMQPFAEKISLKEEGYTVALKSNNKAYTAHATFESEIMAQTYMEEQIARQPGLKKELQIIPNYELQSS